MPANDVQQTNAYLVKLGLRPLVARADLAVLELRGGTHLVVLAAEEPVAAGTPAPFDLMVEDLDAAHRAYAALGLAPSPIERGEIHNSFELVEPGGQTITVNSSHVVGVV